MRNLINRIITRIKVHDNLLLQSLRENDTLKKGDINMEKVKKRRKIKTGMIQDYILAAIPLLYIFVFSYLPMCGIIIAFKSYRYDKGIFGSDWVGLKNFEFFFASNDFARIVRNTLVMNVIFMIIQ